MNERIDNINKALDCLWAWTLEKEADESILELRSILCDVHNKVLKEFKRSRQELYTIHKNTYGFKHPEDV